MNILPYSSAVFILIIVLLIIFIAFKIFIKKERPDNSYTPFDYITGQTGDEFYEEQEEKEEDNPSDK
ncbi:DUF3951 domain-containing protein [Virgibacillus flavescens]|uniref:DUF3951 domain-containing protein n=1 Tax=Virgibacillus flavescens TaxID=1611422 RepID=UPI003D3557B4